VIAVAFTREHLRAPLTLGLLITIPAIFVWAATSVLGDFARALGGSLAANAASALGAGWSAAFIAGALGFFQASSSHGADRRLALAGLGASRVAASRIGASIALAIIASAAGFLALVLRTGVAHPAHAAVAVLAFALIYLGIGTVVGSIVHTPLEGSLAVAFIFLLDVFSGPGMAREASPLSLSRQAADVLISAATAQPSSTGDWLKLGGVVALSLGAALTMFTLAARSRA